MILLLLGSLLVASEAGGEEEPAGFYPPDSKNEEGGIHRKGAQILGVFLLLGGIAYGAMQWQKRRGLPQGKTIRVVAVKPLGQREKVAILDVLGERMVLGVTAHRISLLSPGRSRFAELMEEDETA
jgi:flagellar biosynthetic protein FliO